MSNLCDKDKNYFAFLFACSAIGGVAESSGRFTARLHDQIGESWEQMTVADLLKNIERARAEFNRIEKIARGEE